MARQVLLWILICLPAVVVAQPSAAVDAQRQRVVLALATEPPSLDAMVATDQISSFVLSHVMEGLLQYGPSGELTAGVAQRWELRPDGARFWLRRDARWSDGKPVTANDFVFAWRRAVNPETASQYAFILYPIANAEAISRGELPVAALGVEAVNDYELAVRFSAPCPYFLSLTAFMTYYPAREDVVQRWGRAYASDHDKMLYNGPYTLSRWVHSAHLTLSKNPRYWNRGAVALSEIDMPYITSDAGAQYNLFKDGRIAMAALDTGTLGDAVERGYEVQQFLTGSLFFLQFNFREGRLTANKALRKAIQAVMDPALLVYKVIGLPGVLPAYSLFPMTVRGGEGPLRDVHPEPRIRYDLRRARQWLAQAQRELGLERMPPLVLLAGDSPRAAQEAEYFQYLLSKALGLEVRIDAQTFKQRLEKMGRGDFDIVVGGWGPDFDDALTFADLFSSWNENNRGRYRSDEYDHWVRIAQQSFEPAQRLRAFAEIQRLVVEDVPILPTYESANIYVQHPRLQGMRRSIFGGDPNFRYARVQ